ncbi:hypothetical protein L3X38_045484 [Prunus dulcis]|uniref:Uncharacterized protein n=1 Tax=Prunus dulcis TaxID=3755 RepID=A0AAD4URH3_PRUDU|nr:hypothetical protein L3X38_045484 [Prunus dulcis]
MIELYAISQGKLGYLTRDSNAPNSKYPQFGKWKIDDATMEPSLPTVMLTWFLCSTLPIVVLTGFLCSALSTVVLTGFLYFALPIVMLTGFLCSALPIALLTSSIFSKPTLTSQRDRGNEEVDFGVGFVTRIDVGAFFWIVVGAIFLIVIIAGNFSSRSRERIRKRVEKRRRSTKRFHFIFLDSPTPTPTPNPNPLFDLGPQDPYLLFGSLQDLVDLLELKMPLIYNGLGVLQFNWGIPQSMSGLNLIHFTLTFGGVKYPTKVVAGLAADGRQIVGRTNKAGLCLRVLGSRSFRHHQLEKCLQEGRAKSTQ